MRKKLLVIIATVAMVVAMMPSMVFAASVSVATLDQLQEALANSEIDEITLTDTIIISEGEDVTLDLQGKTVSMVKADDVTKNHEMIMIKKGKLTIKDTVGGGSLVYEYTGKETYDEKVQNGYATRTIANNQGTLIVENGKIVNKTTSNRISYVVDSLTNSNIGAAYLEIKDGEIIGQKGISVRAYGNCINHTNTLIISGGKFQGGVQLMDSNADKNLMKAEISGGEFTSSKYALYVWSNGDASGIDLAVTGGEFNGNVELYSLSTTARYNAELSGGTYNGALIAYAYGDGSEAGYVQVVKGGTYNGDQTYLPWSIVDGYELDGNEIVCSHDNTAAGEKDPTCTEDGYKNAVVCENCGEVIESGEVVKATGHAYKDGVCEVCGTEEPAGETTGSEQPESNQDDEGKTTVESDEESEDAVDTGDNMNMVIPFVIAGLALAAMAVVVATRRKAN